MVHTRFSQREIILCLCSLIVSGCATVNVPNVAQEGYSVADDERRMFKRADEFAEEFDVSGHIHQNQELEQYLNGLSQNLLSEQHKLSEIKIGVKVVNDPSLNAASLPNGRIYIHSGMLAAMDNEAQLATLLGHEMTHVFNRHALKQFRSLINKTAFMFAASMVAAVAVGNSGAVLVQAGVASSIYGYSQEMEYEADDEGFQMTVHNGYDPRESIKVFEHLKMNIEEEEIKQPFFFSTHPNVVSRIKKYTKLVEALPAEKQNGKVNAAEFLVKVKAVVVNNIRLCLQTGMFKTAERNIDKYVQIYSQEATGFYYKGELYRQRQDHGKKEKKRDKTPDYDEALKAYEQAVNLDNGFALAYKGKGQILQKKGLLDEAKASFRKYLEVKPWADDKEYIEQFIKS